MKRTKSTRTFLFLVVVEQTDEESPSSSFPAAPAVNDKPGLTKATSSEIFPFAKAGRK